jgi:hypothetical protein
VAESVERASAALDAVLVHEGMFLKDILVSSESPERYLSLMICVSSSDGTSLASTARASVSFLCLSKC